jgi:alkylated DNA repair dioxygenase AlkB
VSGPVNGPYERRFPRPEQWVSQSPNESSRRPIRDRAVEETRARVNELAWWYLGEQTVRNASAWVHAPQVADEAAAFLARVERRRIAQAEGWQAGEPGE